MPVDTKFIQKNERLLQHWLDKILPASAIAHDETGFSRRYGLRDGLPHHLIRVLDPALQSELGLPFDELSIPMRYLSALPVADCRVIIVENRTNLLTLPAIDRGIALGGVGDGVTRLRDISWLVDCDVVYWGDVDVDGLRILSNMRKILPGLKSMLMDDQALAQHENQMVDGNGKLLAPIGILTDSENAALAKCGKENLRLEQEKIPRDAVSAALSHSFGLE